MGTRTFPHGEEILIGNKGFVGMASQCVCTCDAKMGEYEEQLVRDYGGTGEKFLKLCGRFQAQEFEDETQSAD